MNHIVDPGLYEKRALLWMKGRNAIVCGQTKVWCRGPVLLVIIAREIGIIG